MPRQIAGVFKRIDRTKQLFQGIEVLTETMVMVGVPDDKSERREGTAINNAELAYIMDKGSVLANIPARPFMHPGIIEVKNQIALLMKDGAKAALKGAKNVEGYLNQIGIIATRSIKNKITEGIPPPLAESTVRGRIARVKGKKRRDKIDAARAAGTPDSRQSGAEGIFTPLILSGQLRNSITYVLRRLRKGARKR